MGNAKHASKIDLSNKNLTSIPYHLFSYRNLKSLNLSCNDLKEIPVELNQIRQLKTLDLSNNSIRHILAKTFDLVNLRFLTLNNNKLKSLPRQIGELTKLERLFLNGNQLEHLPNEIGNLHSLKYLGISRNKFKSFPEIIFDLKSLTHIWVGSNDFVNFPFGRFRTELPNLKKIYTFNPNVFSNDEKSNVTLLKRTRGNVSNILQLMTDNREQPIKEFPDGKRITNVLKNIFISYSHRDNEFKKEIENTLKGLRNMYPDLGFDFWADDRIKAGQMWEEEIKSALDRAGIAILIASRHFIASDFIMKTEVPTLLKNAENKGTLILTVVAGESILSKSPIGQFQWINQPTQPLNGLSTREQDAIYAKLANRVLEHFGSG